MANDVIHHAYVMKAYKNPKVWGIESFLAGDFVELGESGALRESIEAPHPFPVPRSVPLLHLANPELYPFIINLSSSKQNVSLSLVSCSSKLIKPKERVVGTSNL